MTLCSATRRKRKRKKLEFDVPVHREKRCNGRPLERVLFITFCWSLRFIQIKKSKFTYLAPKPPSVFRSGGKKEKKARKQKVSCYIRKISRKVVARQDPIFSPLHFMDTSKTLKVTTARDLARKPCKTSLGQDETKRAKTEDGKEKTSPPQDTKQTGRREETVPSRLRFVRHFLLACHKGPLLPEEVLMNDLSQRRCDLAIACVIAALLTSFGTRRDARTCVDECFRACVLCVCPLCASRCDRGL